MMDLLKTKSGYRKIKPRIQRKFLRHISNLCGSISTIMLLAVTVAFAYAIYHRINYGNWFGWIDSKYLYYTIFCFFVIAFVDEIAIRWELRLEDKDWESFRDNRAF